MEQRVATFTTITSFFGGEGGSLLLLSSLFSSLSHQTQRCPCRGVCSRITRLTVVLAPQCFTMFCVKSKRDCGRTAHCHFVRFWTARHVMDSWLNIFDSLVQDNLSCKPARPLHTPIHPTPASLPPSPSHPPTHTTTTTTAMAVPFVVGAGGSVASHVLALVGRRGW